MKLCCQRQPYTAIMLAAACATTPCFAQEGNASGAPAPLAGAAGPGTRAQQPSRDVRASQLLGRTISNAGGETLGEFQDLLFDPQTRQVPYAVLSLGGVLGVGEKLYAYPMSALDMRGRDQLVLAMDPEKMKRAPGFTRDRWPGPADAYFEEVERFFGDRAAGGAPPGRRLMRATELIGKDVDDRSGGDAGEIQDLVIDLGRRRISYAVLDFDKAWSADNKLLPLPMSALRFPAERDDDLVLTLERDKLDMSHGFERNLWPDLNTAEFRNRLNAYFLALERPGGRGGSIEEPRSSGDSR